MYKLLSLLLLPVLSQAFLSPLSPTTPTSLCSTPVSGITNSGKFYPETGKVPWDPLNLMNRLDDKGISWFRAAEIKHGRVAMMATIGWTAQVREGANGGEGGRVLLIPMMEIYLMCSVNMICILHDGDRCKDYTPVP